MFKKIKTPIPSRQDVSALNVTSQRYAEIFDADPPEHLGIALLLLVSENGDPTVYQMLLRELARIEQMFDTLLDIASFAQEFVPSAATEIKVAHVIVGQPKGILGIGPATWSAKDEAMVPSVAFYNADSGIKEQQIQGMAMAIRVIERLALAGGSYEPTAHNSFSMTAADANEYDRLVGKLYDDGVGIWCRDLLPYYNAWRNGMLAYLERKPMIPTMRGSLVSSHQPRDLRFVTSDRGPMLIVVKK
jgi:hypothetical protein